MQKNYKNISEAEAQVAGISLIDSCALEKLHMDLENWDYASEQFASIAYKNYGIERLQLLRQIKTILTPGMGFSKLYDMLEPRRGAVARASAKAMGRQLQPWRGLISSVRLREFVNENAAFLDGYIDFDGKWQRDIVQKNNTTLTTASSFFKESTMQSNSTRPIDSEQDLHDDLSYDEFRNEWLIDITNSEYTNVEKGRRFATKLISNWLEFADSNFEYGNGDFHYTDGSGDGGIDAAYLQRGDTVEDSETGDTWFIIQSKYNSAFCGSETLLSEAQKVIATLSGQNTSLSDLSRSIVERISTFRQRASADDKITLVFATCDPLSDDELQVLADIRTIGRERFGSIFDVEDISIKTIYERTREASKTSIKLNLSANLVSSGNNLLVGSVSIRNLYQFLREYRDLTHDLDLIYQKNVRRFLGQRRTVNKGIKQTLIDTPERFGLYNNGITIVVENFIKYGDASFSLTAPYIVNGCQTTKTIWETLDPKLNSGGTGALSDSDWVNRLDQGIVVVKIVKVGIDDHELLTSTTRYTNSQNSVTQKDFIALEKDFQSWSKVFADKHKIYLEIQRGGWDSQKALQRKRLDIQRFDKYISAFDLIKIYAAGWLSIPGTAFAKNPPFAPGGTVFKKITSPDFEFGANDLYAAYLIEQLVQEIGFGRAAKRQTRGQTKFLFCFVLCRLLEYCMNSATIDITPRNITNSVIKVFAEGKDNAGKALKDAALSVVDEYLTPADEACAQKESTFGDNLNNFLKSDRLGTKEFSPFLVDAIKVQQKILRKPNPGDTESDLEIIERAISN